MDLARQQFMQARQAVAAVTAKPELCAYIGQVVRKTREMDQVLMGASSRAAVHLLQAAKVQALMNGRTFLIPDDVKQVCRPVLRHRVTLAAGRLCGRVHGGRFVDVGAGEGRSAALISAAVFGHRSDQ